MRHLSVTLLALSFFLGSPDAASAAQIPVRVHASTAAGEPVRDAYLALVPVWRPWSAPLAEEITGTGSSLFRVPPGTYHVVAGAKGFQVSTEGPFSFSDELGANLNILLRPLARAAGRVTDDGGNPLVGVRVSDSRGAIIPPLAKLSPLAFRHLSSDWSAVTDESGNWSLGVPDGRVPLIFTSDGRAAQWRYYKADDPRPLHVSMLPGATLRMTCDRSDPNMVVTLEREGDDLADSVPRSWQRQVWARWLNTETVTWTTLPAGVYSIYVKYVDPDFFMRRAKRVGKVALPASSDATGVKVILPAVMHPASKILRLYLEGVSPEEVDTDDLEAFGMNASGEVQGVHSVVQDAIGGSVLQVSVDTAKPPFYLVTAGRFVAATSEMTDAKIGDSSDPPVPAALHPRADAHLVVRSADKELQFPKAGWVELRDCSRTIRVKVPMKIRNGDLAQFTAPAGCRNAVLSFTPFEPVLLTKPLRPGDQSLGEFVLHAAASADVRVVREPGGAIVPGAAVSVMASGDDSPIRQRVLVAQGQTGPDGWAHVDGIPVLRELQFVARAPGGDLSVATDAHAEPRGHLVVDPLSIPRPAAIVVAPKIKPAVIAAFPGARVRIVFIQPVDPRRAELEKRQLNVREEGSPVRFEPLKPGRWRAMAIVEVAGSFAMLKIDEVDVKAGETRRIDAELEPLIFQGTVTSGGKPVAARITLENRSAPEIARQHFDSGKDGTFNAVLANQGTYGVVAVRLDSQGDDVPVADVDFSDPSRPVEIVIPSTVAVLAHVRAAGQPVPDALIVSTLTRMAAGFIDQHRRARATDASGNVRFEHLVPGEWIFTTRDEQGRGGAEKSVVLRESEDADVTLNVERANVIQGIVRDPAGIPAPRVRIDCLFLGTTGTPSRSSAETDLDGRFSVDVFSKLSASALCSALESGGLVDAFKAMPGETASVQLSAVTATLRISDWGQRYGPETFWLAAPDGRVISLSAAAEVAGRFGPPFQIPAVAAGHWRVIQIQSIPQWVALTMGLGVTLPAVADVKLEAGAAETIHVYDTPAFQPGAH